MIGQSVEESSTNFLHSKRYMAFLFSSLLSNIGTWMQQIAQPWIILSISHSSFLIGLDSFAMNSPGFIFTLWGGVLSDRFNRMKIVLFFQIIQFICVTTLLGLLIAGVIQVWMIILISVLVGTTDALSMPSFQSIIPSLVTKSEIPHAIALNSTQFNLSRMLGPAIAGIMMVRWGAVACLSANVLSYIPFFISMYWIYPKTRKGLQKEISSKPLGNLSTLSEFKNILQSPDVRTPLLTILFTTLFCGPLMTFSPVVIKDVFHAEVGSFGGVMAAFGLGGLIGAALGLIKLPVRIKKSQYSTGIGALLGLIVSIIALNRSLTALSFLMVLAGAALTLSNLTSVSFLQENASNHQRGKIVSLFQLALQGGFALGGLTTGFLSSHIGITKALLLNGVLAIVIQSANLIMSRRRVSL